MKNLLPILAAGAHNLAHSESRQHDTQKKSVQQAVRRRSETHQSQPAACRTTSSLQTG